MTEIRRKIAELFEYLDSTRASLLDCARDMNQSFAVIRPRDGEWSAAENLAHLALVEDVERRAERGRQLREGDPAQGKRSAPGAFRGVGPKHESVLSGVRT